MQKLAADFWMFKRVAMHTNCGSLLLTSILWRFLLVVTPLLCSSGAWGQVEQKTHTMVVNGQKGTASAVQIDGRTYVDLGTLAHIARGSLDFRGGQIILTVPGSKKTPSHEPTTERSGESGFSRNFATAAIEEIGLLREWASPLANAIQNALPVNDTWVAGYREKAADGLRVASLSVSTAADRNALQLLANEFESVQQWSNELVEMRKSMGAAKYALSPTALREEPTSQKIILCAHLLATMLTSGTFRDDPSCH